jgi:hypothetical protein
MLRLLAQTMEDLTVMSALVQDAAVRPADMFYDAKARRFVMLVQRYRWEADHSRTRIRSALRIEHVLQVQQRKLAATAEIFSLLSLTAEKTATEGDDPAHRIGLVFSGGVSVKIEADSLNVVLEDVTGSWSTRQVPAHDV